MCSRKVGSAPSARAPRRKDVAPAAKAASRATKLKADRFVRMRVMRVGGSGGKRLAVPEGGKGTVGSATTLVPAVPGAFGAGLRGRARIVIPSRGAAL